LFVIVAVADVRGLLTYREYLIGVRQRKNKRRKVADQEEATRASSSTSGEFIIFLVLFRLKLLKGNGHCLAFVLRK
jgi:hypothetical protein